MAGSAAANDNAARKENIAIEADFSVCNLEEESENGGWLKTTTPEGGPVPEIITAGTRGFEKPKNRSVSRIRS